MSKKKKSYSDTYKEQMMLILAALQKEEVALEAFPTQKTKAEIKKQQELIKKMISHRRMLSNLFFAYLLEDED